MMEQNESKKKKSPISLVILLCVLLAFAVIFAVIRHNGRTNSVPAQQTQVETAAEQGAAAENPITAENTQQGTGAGVTGTAAEGGETTSEPEETETPFAPMEVEEDPVIELEPDEGIIIH